MQSRDTNDLGRDNPRDKDNSDKHSCQKRKIMMITQGWGHEKTIVHYTYKRILTRRVERRRSAFVIRRQV